VKPIRIPLHTLQNLHDRDIPISEVERAIQPPDKIAAGYDQREVYMRRYHDPVLKREMLLRVVVEETETEFIVVTVYKTSQVQRYLKGASK
jgi:hypothetical protein